MRDPVALGQLPMVWQELCSQPNKGPGVDYLSTQARKQAGCCSIAGLIGEPGQGYFKNHLRLEDWMQLQGFSLDPEIHKPGPNLHEGNKGNNQEIYRIIFKFSYSMFSEQLLPGGRSR